MGPEPATIINGRWPLTAWDLADPVNIEGNAETAQVLGLMPWMDYEFRVSDRKSVV